MKAADLKKGAPGLPGGAEPGTAGMGMNTRFSCRRGRGQSKTGSGTGHEVQFVPAALDLLPLGLLTPS